MVEGFVAQSVADELSVATVSNQGVIAGYLNAFCFFGVQAFVLCSIIVVPTLCRDKHFIGSKNGNFVILTTELNTNELLQHLNPDI
jgi:hypothetical protein